MVDTQTTSASAQPPVEIKVPQIGATVDFATLLGVAGAFAMIAGAIVLSGQAAGFLDVPSILIVVGGTFLVTTISFSLGEIIQAQGLMVRAAIYHAETPENAVWQALYLADMARKRGRLALQNVTEELRDAPFHYRAINMVVDGIPAELVERVLARDAAAAFERHHRSAGILRRAGEVSPAMGLIGTLIGLVQMLGSLDDPSSIGPAMAVALLTTFYGAVLANMVFNPLASQLGRTAPLAAPGRQNYPKGAAAISRPENPRRLEMMLNTILPPSNRVDFFE